MVTFHLFPNEVIIGALGLGPEHTFLGHSLSKGERKDSSRACMNPSNPGVAGGSRRALH